MIVLRKHVKNNWALQKMISYEFHFFEVFFNFMLFCNKKIVFNFHTSINQGWIFKDDYKILRVPFDLIHILRFQI